MCSLTHVLIIATIVVSVNDVILKLYLVVGAVVGVTVTRVDGTCVITCIGVSGMRVKVLKLKLLVNSGTTYKTGGDVVVTGGTDAAALATDAALSVNTGGAILLRLVCRYICALNGRSNGVSSVVTSLFSLLPGAWHSFASASEDKDNAADGGDLRLTLAFGGIIAL